MVKKATPLAKLAQGPKSNKIKRQEKKLKDEKERIDAANREAELRTLAARQTLDESLRRDRYNTRRPEESIRNALKGVKVQVAKNTDLYPIIQLCNQYHGYPVDHKRLVREGSLYRLLVTIREKSDFLTGYQPERFARGLMALAACEGDWVRPIEDWVPETHNAHRQFHSLVRHLCTLYPVPWFMDTAWYGGIDPVARKQQEWFKHIGIGKNIRTADGLPVPLTKKQAHNFLEAPGDFTIPAAFRWAQMRDLGADERMVRALIPTRIGSDFRNDDFWYTVLRWLVDNPMLDNIHYGPIIDYLQEQRYVPTMPNPAVAADWMQPRLIPAQPNLSMHHRDADALLRAVQEWHHRLGKERSKKGDYSWNTSGIMPFIYEEGQDVLKKKIYSIEELLSTTALREEGRAMSHCAASYAMSCSKGAASMWSMKLGDTLGNRERLVTIEVRDHTIVQVRRKYNAYPSVKEYSILRRWADSASLTMSSYIRTH